MNIAYVRISTLEPNEAGQVEGLKQYNIDKWFIDNVSDKATNRPKLKEMLKFAKEYDTIYINSLDRLVKSTNDLLDIIDQLQSKGVHLIIKRKQ